MRRACLIGAIVAGLGIVGGALWIPSFGKLAFALALLAMRVYLMGVPRRRMRS
ncbi:MAG: hypothetical protein MUC63_10020 [Planctomycetes bacterium]|nr:hypothetical protein [Planctomycetota bacterium]